MSDRVQSSLSVRVEKRPIRVVVYTPAHRIEGSYHAFAGARIIDDLNSRQKDFVPLTDVRITRLDDETATVLTCPVLAINKRNITLFAPREE